MNVVIIPSATGGLGHIVRTATLARVLSNLTPDVNIEYVLESDNLRPYNIDVARQTGFPVKVLPAFTRETRAQVIRQYFAHADVVIDDCRPWLIPIRLLIPNAAWVSIQMYPLADELFLAWTHLAHSDAIIWPYLSQLPFPDELEMFSNKVLRCGPLIDLENVSTALETRPALGFRSDEELVVYSPRGMPYGWEFGQRVLTSIFRAVTMLRNKGRPLRLVLLSVREPEKLEVDGILLLEQDWITIRGIVEPSESIRYLRAADIAVTEGTNTTYEALALGTPIVMVPGTITEIETMSEWMRAHNLAHSIDSKHVTSTLVADAFESILVNSDERAERVARGCALIAAEPGVVAAARLVLDIITTRRDMMTDRTSLHQ